MKCVVQVLSDELRNCSEQGDDHMKIAAGGLVVLLTSIGTNFDASMKRSRTYLANRDKFPEQLTYVEFYAGVGGWSSALHQVVQELQPTVSLVCAAAIDHSDLCMSVYRHNHARHDVSRCPGDPPRKKKEKTAVRIEDLTPDELVQWKAEIFLMSPPCQPHSRQHTNQATDLQDPRTKSFLHLCSLLEELPYHSLPKIVLLENVVGFESSKSCDRWRHVLGSRNYRTGHFHLQPTQVHIPNDRPRYYTVAVLDEQGIAINVDTATHSLVRPLERYLQREKFPSEEGSTVVANTERPRLVLHTVIPELGVVPLDSGAEVPTLENFLDVLSEDESINDLLKLPDKVIESSAAWCMDLVAPNNRRSACFTSSYGKFIRGTGSILYTGNEIKSFALSRPQDREYDPHWAETLDVRNNLRYFSGTEMARLLGFPDQFSFPDEITQKQRWKLMGNSLNVRIAARLIHLAFCVRWTIPPTVGDKMTTGSS